LYRVDDRRFSGREEIIHRLLHDPEYRKQNRERGALYVDYLNSTAKRDLQK
jgi:ATP-dependent protease Clp ATPase subunit